MTNHHTTASPPPTPLGPVTTTTAAVRARPSDQTIVVGLVLTQRPNDEHWAGDVAARANLHSGTVSRTLQRMRDAGWLTDHDEPTNRHSDPSALSTMLRQCRDSRGVSLRQLAKPVGVSPSTVMRWEAGQLVPAPAAVIRHLDALQVVGDERATILTLAEGMRRQQSTRPRHLYRVTPAGILALRNIYQLARGDSHYRRWIPAHAPMSPDGSIPRQDHRNLDDAFWSAVKPRQIEPPPRARCEECGKDKEIRDDGLLKGHIRERGIRCPGSYLYPDEQRPHGHPGDGAPVINNGFRVGASAQIVAARHEKVRRG